VISARGTHGCPRSNDRQQPMCEQQCTQIAQLALPPDKRCRLHRQICLVECLERREIVVTKLEEALRLSQVLQPVLAEVTSIDAGIEEIARRMRLTRDRPRRSRLQRALARAVLPLPLRRGLGGDAARASRL